MKILKNNIKPYISYSHEFFYTVVFTVVFIFNCGLCHIFIFIRVIDVSRCGEGNIFSLLLGPVSSSFWVGKLTPQRGGGRVGWLGGGSPRKPPGEEPLISWGPIEGRQYQILSNLQFWVIGDSPFPPLGTSDPE